MTFFNPSLFNFQAPQSKKPLLKKGSVLGSYLLDDKPVKRLDGHLCCVRGVILCPLEHSVKLCPLSGSMPRCYLSVCGNMGEIKLDCWHEVVWAQREAQDVTVGELSCDGGPHLGVSVGQEASRLPLGRAALLKCLDHLPSVLFLLRQKPCLLVPRARACVPGAWERAGLAQGWCSLQQLKALRRRPSSRWVRPAHLPPYLCKCSPDTPGLLASQDRQPFLCGLCLSLPLYVQTVQCFPQPRVHACLSCAGIKHWPL